MGHFFSRCHPLMFLWGEETILGVSRLLCTRIRHGTCLHSQCKVTGQEEGKSKFQSKKR